MVVVCRNKFSCVWGLVRFAFSAVSSFSNDKIEAIGYVVILKFLYKEKRNNEVCFNIKGHALACTRNICGAWMVFLIQERACWRCMLREWYVSPGLYCISAQCTYAFIMWPNIQLQFTIAVSQAKTLMQRIGRDGGSPAKGTSAFGKSLRFFFVTAVDMNIWQSTCYAVSNKDFTHPV